MSATLLPKYPIEGQREDETPDQAATRLHLKKNRVEPPDIDFPPYQYSEFPCAMYREWDDTDRYRQERREALRLGLNLDNPREAQLIAQSIPPYDSCNVESEAERRAKHEQGWADTPNGVKDAKRRAEMAIARIAAELNYEDRKLSPRAAAEKETIDDLADHHIIDVPETRREVVDALGTKELPDALKMKRTSREKR